MPAHCLFGFNSAAGAKGDKGSPPASNSTDTKGADSPCDCAVEVDAKWLYIGAAAIGAWLILRK